MKEFFGLLLGNVVFKTVNTNLWQSESPLNVIVVFWKAKELLVKKRSMVLGLFAFLKQVLSLARFSRSCW